MDLKITLEDERLCKGCPMNGHYSTVCDAGFRRETAAMSDEQFPGQSLFGVNTQVQGIGFNPIRPLACLLANERAKTVLDKAPVAIAETSGKIAKRKTWGKDAPGAWVKKI